MDFGVRKIVVVCRFQVFAFYCGVISVYMTMGVEHWWGAAARGDEVLGENPVVMLLSISRFSQKVGSNRTRPYAAGD